MLYILFLLLMGGVLSFFFFLKRETQLKYYKIASLLFLSRIPPLNLFISLRMLWFIEMPTAAESLVCFVCVLSVLVLQNLPLA